MAESKEFAEKPVQEGDVLEVEVEEEGDQGDGLVRIDGFVVFVEGASRGYSGDVEITNVGPDFGFAEAIE